MLYKIIQSWKQLQIMITFPLIHLPHLRHFNPQMFRLLQILNYFLQLNNHRYKLLFLNLNNYFNKIFNNQNKCNNNRIIINYFSKIYSKFNNNFKIQIIKNNFRDNNRNSYCLLKHQMIQSNFNLNYSTHQNN